MTFHYTYRITNKVTSKHYYGMRSCKIEPQNDIGVIYFSSSYDKEFMKDQKENPQNYKYKVIKVHDTREKATEQEIKLHEKLDVARNESFYNRSKQTKVGFNVMGNKEAKKKQSLAAKGLRNANYGQGHKQSGAKNGRAIKIEIYNDKDELMFTCLGDFKKVCEVNDLPFTPLRTSYLNQTKVVYRECVKSLMRNNGNGHFIKYEGWYALKIK